jgi:hypothetical protein
MQKLEIDQLNNKFILDLLKSLEIGVANRAPAPTSTLHGGLTAINVEPPNLLMLVGAAAAAGKLCKIFSSRLVFVLFLEDTKKTFQN